MHHAACKVEFQPFNPSCSQLTFFNFLFKKIEPPGGMSVSYYTNNWFLSHTGSDN